MARRTPRTPLRRTPTFIRAARLDIPFSALIEFLLELDSSKKSGTVGPETLTAGWKARPRHQKSLGPTWGYPRRQRASPAHPTRGGPQSRWFEVVDHSRERGMSYSQSSWPCFRHDRRLHDRWNSKCDMPRRHVEGLQEPAPHRAAGFGGRERWDSPTTGHH